MTKKWKVWFLTYGDPKWYTSGVEWDTETAAIQHARDKFRAWTQAQSWCVMVGGENPNQSPLIVPVLHSTLYTKEVMAVIEEAAIQSTMEGTVDGECSKCGYSTTVEPDASYKCHECGEGVMQSPLRKYGLI